MKAVRDVPEKKRPDPEKNGRLYKAVPEQDRNYDRNSGSDEYPTKNFI